MLSVKNNNKKKRYNPYTLPLKQDDKITDKKSFYIVKKLILQKYYKPTRDIFNNSRSSVFYAQKINICLKVQIT